MSGITNIILACCLGVVPKLAGNGANGSASQSVERGECMAHGVVIDPFEPLSSTVFFERVSGIPSQAPFTAFFLGADEVVTFSGVDFVEVMLQVFGESFAHANNSGLFGFNVPVFGVPDGHCLGLHIEPADSAFDNFAYSEASEKAEPKNKCQVGPIVWESSEQLFAFFPGAILLGPSFEVAGHFEGMARISGSQAVINGPTEKAAYSAEVADHTGSFEPFLQGVLVFPALIDGYGSNFGVVEELGKLEQAAPRVVAGLGGMVSALPLVLEIPLDFQLHPTGSILSEIGGSQLAVFFHGNVLVFSLEADLSRADAFNHGRLKIVNAGAPV
ncbi:MAG: hypothetical protein AAF226_11780, partial [Verrucomicrobiota bacterium]